MHKNDMTGTETREQVDADAARNHMPYLPTPQDIAKACDRMELKWTDAVKAAHKRLGGKASDDLPYEIPSVARGPRHLGITPDSPRFKGD